ncbi:MAG: type I-C CRISPR-associated protein Cas5c, partial [Gracilibacteraceae bacterium]|nr:type I-C CRISPR-associated protein Cas5c [Gracilibacteraceae bacterium]
MAFTLEISGDYACFSRPELKVERVSYDVITPSAARGIFEAILWKPAIKWVIDEICICKPIKFENIRRNEVQSKASRRATIAASEDRTQRAAMVLKNVCYVVTAHFEMTSRAGEPDSEAKFAAMFERRAIAGQTFNQPYLGTREFPAKFRLISAGKSEVDTIKETRSLGIMLYDLDY